MGTLMTWILAHAVDRGVSCQMVIRVRFTASAVSSAAGPRAIVVVRGGRDGSARHVAPGPVMVSPWPLVSTIAVAPPGPKEADIGRVLVSRSGGDSAQRGLLPAVQAARRVLPAASNATVPLGVLVSLSTCTCWVAREAGRVGPAACQVPLVSAKMPAVPGWEQVPARSGCPAGLTAAAVRLSSPQRLPGAVAARVRRLARVLHLVYAG